MESNCILLKNLWLDLNQSKIFIALTIDYKLSSLNYCGLLLVSLYKNQNELFKNNFIVKEYAKQISTKLMLLVMQTL